jgi:hypothetical protein
VIAAAVAVSATLAVGPAFAGDSVTWGEEARNGAVRVMKDGVLVHRVAPATARETERGFGGTTQVFAASAERFAAIVSTSTVVFAESDSVTIANSQGLISGRFDGATELLAGTIPRRGDQGCRGRPAYEQLEGVDVDGDRVAFAMFSDECTADNGPWDDSVVVISGGARTTIPTGQQAFIRDVALAGRYVGWVREASRTDTSEIVVRDLEAGVDVIRLTADDLAARRFDELALQDDGTVAFRVDNRNFSRIAWAAPGNPGVRVLDRGRFDGLALAGGRVLYERTVSERRFTGELILRPLDGPARRLAFFPERRRRVGDLDLDATRATWATQPTGRGYEPPPRGPARIVVRAL